MADGRELVTTGVSEELLTDIEMNIRSFRYSGVSAFHGSTGLRMRDKQLEKGFLDNSMS